jgi:hypothetical protein
VTPVGLPAFLFSILFNLKLIIFIMLRGLN